MDGEPSGEPFDFNSESDMPGPTNYELESKASVEGWKEVRYRMMVTVTEAAAMSSSQGCVICSEAASLRCQRCGSLGFYCLECFQKAHSSVNFFHVPEKWEVMYNELTEQYLRV